MTSRIQNNLSSFYTNDTSLFMSTRTIELVTFENDSVLNQKSISLPIGKVSIRQTAILFSGILVTFLVFMNADNLVVSGLVFAVFLGIGLIGTRVMTADQMIKSHLRMLIRGTSLEQKPQSMEKPKKQQQQHTGNEKSNSKQNEQQRNNNGLVNQVLSQIESFYKKKENVTANAKKESKSIDDKVENNKKFSASIELTDQNIIHVTSKSNNDFAKPLLSTEKENNNDLVDSLLKKFSKKEKTEFDSTKNHITISLDGKPIDESNEMIIESREGSLSLILENNQRYAITITADDETPETLQD